jgi:hypothetical protein
MNTSPSAKKLPAFTRLDLLALLAGLGLLGLLAVPGFAGPRSRSERVLCANNLRQIGMAMQIWANDHGDLMPQEVPVAQGGTSLHPLAVNVWLHFSWISNELATAQALFCPSDQGQPARDFTGDPTGGYVHPNFANQATSYLLTHIGVNRPTELLAADRNVGNGGVVGCARFNTAYNFSFSLASTYFRWDTNLHDKAGNALSFDGHVNQTDNAGLRSYFDVSMLADNGSLHFIKPR